MNLQSEYDEATSEDNQAEEVTGCEGNRVKTAIGNMFSELRKFKVGMILAHQYMHQLDEYINQTVLRNIGIVISFRIWTEMDNILFNFNITINI